MLTSLLRRDELREGVGEGLAENFVEREELDADALEGTEIAPNGHSADRQHRRRKLSALLADDVALFRDQRLADQEHDRIVALADLQPVAELEGNQELATVEMLGGFDLLVVVRLLLRIQTLLVRGRLLEMLLRFGEPDVLTRDEHDEVVHLVHGQARQVFQGRRAAQDLLRDTRRREAEVSVEPFQCLARVVVAHGARAHVDRALRAGRFGGLHFESLLHRLLFRLLGDDQAREQGLGHIDGAVGRAESGLILDGDHVEVRAELRDSVRAETFQPDRVQTMLVAERLDLGGQLGLVGLTDALTADDEDFGGGVGGAGDGIGGNDGGGIAVHGDS